MYYVFDILLLLRWVPPNHLFKSFGNLKKIMSSLENIEKHVPNGPRPINFPDGCSMNQSFPPQNPWDSRISPLPGAPMTSIKIPNVASEDSTFFSILKPGSFPWWLGVVLLRCWNQLKQKQSRHTSYKYYTEYILVKAETWSFPTIGTNLWTSDGWLKTWLGAAAEETKRKWAGKILRIDHQP